jgi:superfamily II DNA or RNA helicase
MNDPVYGGIIAKATASELIEGGYILKPKVISHLLEWVDDRQPQHDADDILSIIEEYDLSKLLVCVKSTIKMMDMLTETNFAEKLEEKGYDLLHITSQHGAFYNGDKIERDKFFELLDELGSSTERKYVILNYSILGEGINVKSLDAVLLMRQLNLIKLVQNIGRTLRISTEDAKAIEEGTLQVGDYESYLKPEGKVIIPVYNKSLLAASESIQTTVVDVYENGEIPIMQDSK